MIIELLTLKLTMDAIMDHVNNVAYQQQVHEEVRVLKARLLKLTADFGSGRIGKSEFEKKEKEIVLEIDAVLKRITTNKSNVTQSSSDLGGLTGLL